MAVSKLAISLPPDLAEQVRESAEAKQQTVSGWLAEAAQKRLRAEALDRFLDDLDRELGPVPAAMVAAAGERLDAPLDPQCRD